MRNTGLAFVAVVSLMLVGCSDGDSARRVLLDQGYTNVETTGFAWWGCDRNDVIHTGFKATGPTGRKVSGVVCGGWGWFGKASTVRVF